MNQRDMAELASLHAEMHSLRLGLESAFATVEAIIARHPGARYSPAPSDKEPEFYPMNSPAEQAPPNRERDNGTQTVKRASRHATR